MRPTQRRRPDGRRVTLDVGKAAREQFQELGQPLAATLVEFRLPANRRQGETLAEAVFDRFVGPIENRQHRRNELFDVGPRHVLAGLQRRRGGRAVM